MTLPYRWRAEGTANRWFSKIQVGDLVAFEHDAWRVVAIHQLDPANVEPGRPDRTVQVRPVGSDSIATHSDDDIHLGASSLDVFPDEHYPVCSKCLKPQPCPEVSERRYLEAALKRTRRYEIPGVCPACEEPVTPRQARQTWPGNLVVPNGEPVTFHLRDKCSGGAVSYDTQWRKAGHQSLLGFEPDAEAVERLLSELDGQDSWGRSGNSSTMRRYSSLIPPKLNRHPRPCRQGIDGCMGKQTHTGCANGIALTGGCESCVDAWVVDPDVRPTAQVAAPCASSHLHIDGDLSASQRRAGLSASKCGCRRGVKRLVASTKTIAAIDNALGDLQ